MFEIEVVSSPTASLYPTSPMWELDLTSLRQYDENLIKPTLLFADKITLRSDRIDMLRVAEARAIEMYRMPMRRRNLYIGLSLHPDPETLELIGLAATDLAPPEEARVANELGHVPPDEDRFWIEHESRIDAVGEAVLELWRERRQSLWSSDINKAVEAGLVSLSGWASEGDDPWTLAWTDEGEFFAKTIGDVLTSISESSGAVMLEPGSQYFLTREPQRGSEPAGPVEALSAASLISHSVLGRLPGLSDMSVDEILEVRGDLKDYLPAFRAGMARLATEISTDSAASSIDLAQAIDHRWATEIDPVLQELQRQVRRGGYPRQLLNAFASDAQTQISSIASVALAAGSAVAGAAALIPAAATAAVPYVKALNDTLRTRDAARDNQLFFLYEADRRTRRRAHKWRKGRRP